MKKVLVIAPHPDDEIIGVGGTIIKHIKNKDEVYVCIATKGQMPIFSPEDVDVVRKEAIKCHKDLGIKKTYFLDFPAAMMEDVKRYEMNNRFIEVIKEVKPDVVYIPHIGDMQKDHQIVVESVMVALRPKYDFAPKKIYAYETLSETGWNIPNIQNEFIPNAYVDISEELDNKIKAMSFYQSQVAEFPNARSIETIEALAKFRGSVMNMCAAEAFMLIREIK